MDSIEDIVNGLTLGERAWLLRQQDRSHTDLSAAALSLECKGLVKPIWCSVERNFGHVATRKGLRVRALIQEPKP